MRSTAVDDPAASLSSGGQRSLSIVIVYATYPTIASLCIAYPVAVRHAVDSYLAGLRSLAQP